MTDKKLKQVLCKPHHLWTGRKAIKKLHKIMPIPEKDVKPWLAKQALWQVHIPPPKEINHHRYNVTEPNK